MATPLRTHTTARLEPPSEARETPEPQRLLPAETGHIATGSRPPKADTQWIEAHLARVGEALAWTRETGRECGFLAYLPRARGEAPVSEEMSHGTKNEISWRWEHTKSAVAFTFHTHPGSASVPMPSGLDALGATVRGDHVHYIMDAEGRLVGWRFRDARQWPQALQEALLGLSESHRLDRRFVSFITEALEVLALTMMEPCYGARVSLEGEGVLLTRCDPRELLPDASS